jgi:hypothetical protein
MQPRISSAGTAVGQRLPRLAWFVLLLVLLLPWAGLPAAPAAAAGPPAAAAVAFQVTYAAGVPQEVRDAFAASTAVWAALLNSTVPIQVSVTWTPGGDCSQACTLASAGPTDMIQNFPHAPRTGTLYPIALANSLAGTKQNQGADIDANFNSQANWYYGQGAPPAGKNSFISTAVHELAHGLGFSATLDYNSANQQGKFTTPPNIFDRFVINGTGATLIDSFANNSTALGAQLTSGAVYFGGPNARQVAGGTVPKLFAPSPWQPGSSISHLDQATYNGGPNTLMTPSDDGGGTATPGPITEAIFKDLGWPGSTAVCGQRFGDVPSSDPACTAIEALATRGVIKGCDQAAVPPLFCPLQPTLRAQMAALIVRAMAWGSETPANLFSDKCDPLNTANCVDDELWNAVGVLAAKGVAKGYTDGATCAPANAPCYAARDNVLYAQVISFITRAMVQKGYWMAATSDDGTVYPNIPVDSGHRLDFVTYTNNVGPVPGTSSKTQNFDAWNQPATRAWFAQALWLALQGH